MDALGHLEVLRDVPAGAVEHEQDVLRGPSADRFGEVLQGQGEDGRVHLGQEGPLHLAASGPHEAVEVHPLVVALPERLRRSPAPGPHATHDGDQPEAGLVLGPELDSRAGTLSMKGT